MASTLTKHTAAERVIARLVERGESLDGLFEPDIASWVTEALQRLARIVADGAEFFELQKLVTATVTSGKADMPSDILVDTIPHTGQVSLTVLNTFTATTNGVNGIITSNIPIFSPTDYSGLVTIPGIVSGCLNLSSCSGGGTYTGGVASVQSSTQATLSCVPCSGTSSPTATYLRTLIAKWKPRQQALLVSQAQDLAHYSILGRSIYVKEPFSGGSTSSSVVVLANFVPTLSGTGGADDLPNRFEDLLINILIQMVGEKKNLKPTPLIS